MIKPIIRQGNNIRHGNRLFKITGVWFLGNKATSYELQEIVNGKEVGPIVKKEAVKIDPLVEACKITIEK